MHEGSRTCAGYFFSFFRPTRIRRRMFRLTEASISYSNLSAMVTCEHADSASSPTCLLFIGRGGKPREPDRCSLDTLGPTVSKDPWAGAALPSVALPGTLMPVPRFTKSHSKPPTSSLS
jgi:hypothetical protein